MKIVINFIILINNRFLRTAKRKRVILCRRSADISHYYKSRAYVPRRVDFLLDFPGLQASSFSDHVARAASHVGQRRILLDRIRALKGKVSEIILELFPGRLYFPTNLVAKQTKSFSSVGRYIRGVV